MKANFKAEEVSAEASFELRARISFGEYMRPLLVREGKEIVTAFAHDIIHPEGGSLSTKKEIWVEGRTVEFLCEASSATDDAFDIDMHVSVAKCPNEPASRNVIWLGDRNGTNDPDRTLYAEDRDDEEPEVSVYTQCERRAVIDAFNCEDADEFLYRSGVLYASPFKQNTMLLERAGKPMCEFWGAKKSVLVLPDSSVLRDLETHVLAKAHWYHRNMLPKYVLHARLRIEEPVEAGDYSCVVLVCFCNSVMAAVPAITRAAKAITWQEWAEDFVDERC